MADLDQRQKQHLRDRLRQEEQGGPSTSRRKKHEYTDRSKQPQTSDDWPRTGETRTRASPRSRRPSKDIDMDIVESSEEPAMSNDPDDDDDENARRIPRRKTQTPQRRRRLRPRPASSADDSSSEATTPAHTPLRSRRQRSRKASTDMRLPNGSVPVLDTVPHRRPTYTIDNEDDDDDDDDDSIENARTARSGPSRPASRQTIARREPSVHRYRSTPESRRSSRTRATGTDDDGADTDATTDSDEQIISRSKRPPPIPPDPPAPAVPQPPSAPGMHSSLQERLSRRPEMVYEETEVDARSRYAASVGRHRRSRSLSRPPSSRQDQYRRPRDITVSGPPSLDETRRSRSRSKSARPSGRNYESDVYVSSRPASSFHRLHAASSYSLDSSAKRSTYFAPDFPPPRTARPEKPAERTTVCVLCRNPNTPVSQTAKLRCCHRMCHGCLRKVFKQALADPQHMPPRCCDDAIATEHVEGLFDSTFKREWQHRYLEHASRGRRIQCPSRRCGEWMRPTDVHAEAGRWKASCSVCGYSICGACGGRWHSQSECPLADAAEAQSFSERAAAARESWQRCRRCKSAIDIRDGRNHVLCRCGAEFCLACGAKWKTCDCPSTRADVFEAPEPASRQSNPFATRPPSPRDYRSDFAAPPAATAVATYGRARPSSYEEDALRRMHEHREDHLARRMHSFDAFAHHGSHADFGRRRDDYSFDLPDPRGRHRLVSGRRYSGGSYDEDYHRRAATVVAPSPPQPPLPEAPPPPRSAFEPPSRTPRFDRSVSALDYTSLMRRGRDIRYASPDRLDEYGAAENHTTDRRRRRSPDPWEVLSQDRALRGRDRRHTFPSESRPASPDPWQLPTRYPSPERPTPAPEERHRASSPERRRASSLERRRLAGRFSKDSTRQSQAAPSVPVGALGAAGAVGPLTPTRVPPSRAATHVGIAMPMAPMAPPIPHPASPPIQSLRRHHTMDEDLYPPPPMPPGPTDWFGPPLPHGHPHLHPHAHPPPPGMPMGPMGPMGMGPMGPMGMMHHPGAPPPPPPGMHDMVPPDIGMGMGMAMAGVGPGGVMGNGLGPGANPNDLAHHNGMMNGAGMPANGGSPRAPHVKRRPPREVTREHSKVEPPKSSVLAGLTGMGRGMHRVSEWVNYVEPGPPEDGATVVH